MKKLCSLLVAFAASLVLFGTVSFSYATTVEYTASGSGPYILNFNVINNTLTSPIQWFSIYFGQGSDVWKFSNFVPDDNNSTLSPAGWLSHSIEPSTIDNPGQFNSEATAGGIASGGSQGGFSVSFDMSSGASYDHLFFEVGNFDSNNNNSYELLDTGYTQAAQTGVVPEPGTLVLLGAGLGGLLIYRRKRK